MLILTGVGGVGGGASLVGSIIDEMVGGAE